MAIKVSNLKKKYGNLEVLKDISINIEEGEVLCVIGPSGSGKSTFLRCLNALEEVDGGEVLVLGNDIFKKGANINRIREDIGMVFQNFNLFPHLTVLENIVMAPQLIKKVSKKDAELKACELLRKVGLEDKKNNYPSSLSGGQKQRVAL